MLSMILLPSEKFTVYADAIFDKWRGKISAALHSARIEHVGSTSIKNALTKGDIDIFVGVPAIEHEHSIKHLERLGLQIKMDTHRDAELCMLTSIEDRDTSIQLVANDSQYEFFLRFRDLLRDNNELLQKYNKLKLECLSLNEAEYRKKKSDFIRAVL